MLEDNTVISIGSLVIKGLLRVYAYVFLFFENNKMINLPFK